MSLGYNKKVQICELCSQFVGKRFFFKLFQQINGNCWNIIIVLQKLEMSYKQLKKNTTNLTFKVQMFSIFFKKYPKMYT